MTDDPDPTVAHGEEGPSGDREDRNHGSRENELSGPSNLPSAPPNPVNSRVWRDSGETCDTTLLHTVPKRPLKKRGQTKASSLEPCRTNLHHQSSNQPKSKGSSRPSGLILRGTTFYLRLRVPRHLSARSSERCRVGP